jgi:hypothetical protein
MKQRLGTLVVIFGMMTGGFVVPASAAASTAADKRLTVSAHYKAAPPETAGATPLGCSVTPRFDLVSARSRPTVHSRRNGIIYRGQRADAACVGYAGESYTNCGGGVFWIQIIWPSRVTSYVADRCVVWEYD